MQLPVHPLINHAVAVLVPLAALGAILLILVPKFRTNYSTLLLITVIAAPISAFIASNSGQALANRVGSPGEHAIQGERLFKIVLVFSLIYILWFAINRNFIRINKGAKLIKTGITASLITTALASASLTFVVGHSGAAATWEMRIKESAAQPINPGKEGTSVPAPDPSKSAATGKVNLTATEIQKHATEKDCWSIVKGKVYNLTSYVYRHPGGASVVKNICGKDGTNSFSNQHGSSGKPNSVLDQFLIGTFGSTVSTQKSNAVMAPAISGSQFGDEEEEEREEEEEEEEEEGEEGEGD